MEQGRTSLPETNSVGVGSRTPRKNLESSGDGYVSSLFDFTVQFLQSWCYFSKGTTRTTGTWNFGTSYPLGITEWVSDVRGSSTTSKNFYFKLKKSNVLNFLIHKNSTKKSLKPLGPKLFWNWKKRSEELIQTANRLVHSREYLQKK